MALSGELRFYIDPGTGEPHVYQHNVHEIDVADVVRKPLETTSGREGSSVVLGQTRGGRYLKVIVVPDDDGMGIFVVTAYDLPAKQITALKRRLRRSR